MKINVNKEEAHIIACATFASEEIKAAKKLKFDYPQDLSAGRLSNDHIEWISNMAQIEWMGLAAIGQIMFSENIYTNDIANHIWETINEANKGKR